MALVLMFSLGMLVGGTLCAGVLCAWFGNQSARRVIDRETWARVQKASQDWRDKQQMDAR